MFLFYTRLGAVGDLDPARRQAALTRREEDPWNSRSSFGDRRPAGHLVAARRQAGEDLGRHRLRLVPGPLRDDAVLAFPRRAEPLGRPLAGRARGLLGAGRAASSTTTRSARRTASRSSRRRPGATSTCWRRCGAGIPCSSSRRARSYTLHLSSMDINHGFSLYPVNINFQVVPGYDYGLKIVPNKPGEFRIICNEFCGIGHHKMVGKIVVDRVRRRLTEARHNVPIHRRERPSTAGDRRFRDLRRSTGLKVNWHAESLVKVNAVVAVVTSCRRHRRVLLVLTRWQAVHLLPADLVLPHPDPARPEHADLLHHLLRDGDPLLRRAGRCSARGCPRRELGWLAFALMVARHRWSSTRWSCRGKADVLFTSYPPLQGASALLPRDHPLRGRRAHRDAASSSPRSWSPSASRPTRGRSRS